MTLIFIAGFVLGFGVGLVLAVALLLLIARYA